MKGLCRRRAPLCKGPQPPTAFRPETDEKQRQTRTRYRPIAEAGAIPPPVEQGFAIDEARRRSERHPAELFDINLYDYDDEGQVSLRTGARGRLDGAELLAAIQQGRLWVNLRSVETGWPELWAAAMGEFGKVQAAYPGLRAVKNAGQLILSSPKARVPYHFDAAGVVLFHMRGRKRIFVYPGDEAHLAEVDMERWCRARPPRNFPMSAPSRPTPRSWIWSRARP
jgi:hypothetical protein